NAYTVVPGIGLEYDDNGALIHGTSNTVEPQAFGMGYSYQDQMIVFSNLTTRAIYKCDAFGRRFEKVVFGDQGIQTNRFYFDGLRQIEEESSSTGAVVSYFYGQDLNDVLKIQRGTNFYMCHSDDLYSILALSDRSGAVV